MGDNEQDPVVLEHSNGWQGYELLGRFLEEDGWYPQAIEGTTAYLCNFSGTNAQFRVAPKVNVEHEQFLVYVLTEIKVGAEWRAEAAEFITRANYGLRIGNFEMDFADGEVRYKSSFDFEGVDLTPELIHNAVYPAVTTMDRYFPGLIKVAYGASSPIDAIEEVESR